MPDPALAANVRGIVARQLGWSIDRVPPDARLAEDLGADSLDRLLIAAEIEDEYRLGLDDEFLVDAVTVDDIIAAAAGRRLTKEPNR